MTKTLCCHLETTGRFLFRELTDNPEQPHLVRLAWVIADDDEIVSAWCNLIKPRNDWVYEDDAVLAHGITPELAWERGIPLERAMSRFVGALEGVERFVAFNVDFNVKVLQRSAAECGLGWQRLFNEHTVACAMRRATDIIQIPRMAPGGGYAWPKFRDAVEFFTDGEELPPLDLDPLERGITLARCVYVIDQGILAHNRGVPHE